MVIVPCPNCGEKVVINIKKATDENGEEFMCPKCRYTFRYVSNR